MNYKKRNEDELALKDIESYYKKREIKECNDPAIHEIEILEMN